MPKFYDLDFEQLPDGDIRLTQNSGIDEAEVIFLHPMQLRAVAEHFGLVHPAPPADELTKKLAEQICRVYLAMLDDYRHLSHILEDECSRLDVFIGLMPDEIFPGHLWDEREERERAAAEANANRQTKRPDVASQEAVDMPVQVARNAEHAEQLGLLV